MSGAIAHGQVVTGRARRPAGVVRDLGTGRRTLRYPVVASRTLRDGEL
ncbi:hypothetical protein [Ruegeria sp. HKCCD4318-2]|nr:hypothetical protein [Ruegeria sp. HKCCD4318-2]